MLLEDKIILVSGGIRGLGAGIAGAAAANGAAGIMITARDPAAGQALAAEPADSGPDVGFHAVDLADPLAAAGSVSATAASYGRVDCVVNSASITARGTLLDTAAARQPMGKLGQVSEIAEFIVSDRSGVVTGSVINWDQNVLGCYD